MNNKKGVHPDAETEEFWHELDIDNINDAEEADAYIERMAVRK